MCVRQTDPPVPGSVESEIRHSQGELVRLANENRRVKSENRKVKLMGTEDRAKSKQLVKRIQDLKKEIKEQEVDNRKLQKRNELLWTEAQKKSLKK